MAQAQSIEIRPHVDTTVAVLQDTVLADSLAIDSLIQFKEDRSSIYESLKDYFKLKGTDYSSWDTFVKTGSHFAPGMQYDPLKYQRPFWVIFVLFFLLLSIGLIRVFFTPIFHNIIYAYYEERVLHQISKEDSLLTSWPYIFLYILFSFSLGLFVVICQSAFYDGHALTLSNFFRISGIVALLFVLKIMLVRFIGVIFDISRFLREYITVLYLVYFNSMLLLLPLLLIVTFVPSLYFNFILYFFSIVVSILFLYRFFRTALSMLSHLRFSIFYLIIYLCTLEIAPILILVKTLNS